MLASWKESYDKTRPCIKKQRQQFADTGSYSQSYGFSSRYVWMWELYHKEGWSMKNWCLWIMVLEKTWESARRSSQSILKEINPKYSLDGVPLKLQYFGHLNEELTYWGGPEIKKPWKTEGKIKRRLQRIRYLDSITDSLNMNLSKLHDILEDRRSCKFHGETISDLT